MIASEIVMDCETRELFDYIETKAEQISRLLQPVVLSCGKEKFGSKWRERSELRESSRAEIGWMLKEHYLGCWPGVVMAQLAIVCDGIPAGCIVYALPPRETIKRYGGMTWELARLWVHDAIPRNVETWIIGKSVKWIKRQHPEVFSLVSYADPSSGHSGTIYKAANWKYEGTQDSERKTPRGDYFCKATGKKFSRFSHAKKTGLAVERRPRIPKHRFSYILKTPYEM